MPGKQIFTNSVAVNSRHAGQRVVARTRSTNLILIIVPHVRSFAFHDPVARAGTAGMRRESWLCAAFLVTWRVAVNIVVFSADGIAVIKSSW